MGKVLQVILSANRWITACRVHTSPKWQGKDSVVPWDFLFNLAQNATAPPTLTSGPLGFIDVILDLRTILLCFNADTLKFN